MGGWVNGRESAIWLVTKSYKTRAQTQLRQCSASEATRSIEWPACKDRSVHAKSGMEEHNRQPLLTWPAP